MPVMGKTSGELKAYIDGIDPVTGKPLMEEIVERADERDDGLIQEM